MVKIVFAKVCAILTFLRILQYLGSSLQGGSFVIYVLAGNESMCRLLSFLFAGLLFQIKCILNPLLCYDLCCIVTRCCLALAAYTTCKNRLGSC